MKFIFIFNYSVALSFIQYCISERLNKLSFQRIKKLVRNKNEKLSISTNLSSKIINIFARELRKIEKYHVIHGHRSFLMA